MTWLLHTCVGGSAGRWRVEGIRVIVGQTLPWVPRLSIFEGHPTTTPEGSIWFEYAPRDAEAFEELVGKLRETEEWTYVEREVDIRLAPEGT